MNTDEIILRSQRHSWFAKQIRTRRGEHGWTQEQLADAIGRTQATVSRWEQGERIPDFHSLQELFRAFGLTDSEQNRWMDWFSRRAA